MQGTKTNLWIKGNFRGYLQTDQPSSPTSGQRWPADREATGPWWHRRLGGLGARLSRGKGRGDRGKCDGGLTGGGGVKGRPNSEMTAPAVELGGGRTS
jgi:hypothetical protein